MWVKNLTQSILENNGIVISFEEDKLYQGGIVLKKVISFPEGEWSLDSLAEIEADTGLIPTTLGPAFVAFNKTLVSYVLPKTLRRIGAAAFFLCTKIKNPPDFPKVLEKIGAAAFYYNESANGPLVIPPRIKAIEKETFFWCANLKSIAFAEGSQLERIEAGAFRRCTGARTGAVDFTPCTELSYIDGQAFMNVEPERVYFGDIYNKRKAQQLAEADAITGYPRASTDWLAGAFGIGVHWTTWSTDLNGEKNSFDEAVEAFDIPRFVAQLKDAKVDYIIFTSSWAEQHPPAPCPALDKIISGRTTKRNLLLEIAQALDAEGIRTILYYNHGCNSEDPEWMKAVGYTDNRLEDFGKNIVSIVRDLSLSCGKYVSGWWFDSSVSVSNAGVRSPAIVKLGDFKYPFDEVSKAAKAGNKDAIVSVNCQGGSFMFTTCQEYYSGEELIYFPLCGRTNAQGMQMHIWLTMDNKNWVHQGKEFSPLRFNDEELSRFLSRHTEDGCAVTLNVDIDRSGLLNPEAIEQIKRIRK
ncbi:MAG: leucine-rich repeat domain-containing protein [Kiritimatiellae bacterium]|nr:leucine-rich repeat domain-containing protein [Kiritimatiellia bacterium]